MKKTISNKKYSSAVWPFSSFAKQYVKWCIWAKEKPSEVPNKAYLNYSIILGSAIYLESTISEGLQKVAYHYATYKEADDLFIRLAEQTEKDAINSGGVEQYKELLELIFGRTIDEIVGKKTWAGVQNLFQLRNMFAHGRSVRFSVAATDRNEIEFKGSYSQVEKYLKQEGVFKRLNVHPGPHDYLADPVAEWAWNLANRVVTTMSVRMPESERKLFFFP